MANKTSKDFMKSVYFKFINGTDKKNMSKKESERPNLSLTAKKFTSIERLITGHVLRPFGISEKNKLKSRHERTE